MDRLKDIPELDERFSYAVEVS